MEFGIATVAAVTALCYLAGLAVNLSKLNSKWIPVICGFTGLILGLLSYYTGVPDFPASDPVTAAAVGAASGLASTGIDQAFKQLRKQ